MFCMNKRAMSPVPLDSSRLRRIAAGVPLYVLGAECGIEPSRISFIERYPAEALPEEISALEKGIVRIVARRQREEFAG